MVNDNKRLIITNRYTRQQEWDPFRRVPSSATFVTTEVEPCAAVKRRAALRVSNLGHLQGRYEEATGRPQFVQSPFCLPPALPGGAPP